jgi:PKD domain-containing protein
MVGEEVTFVSYSEDSDGRISEYHWDLNGDENFDDATGPVATRTFSTAGNKQLTLRVTDDRGASSTVSRTLTVRVPPATSSGGPSTPVAARPPRLLSPFPVVRLVGSAMSRGATVRILSVRAPTRSRVLVRCSGSGCAVKRVEKTARRARLRFGALERWLDAGVVLEIFVRRGDRIGKYTRFEIRANRLPKRTDGCLRPGTLRRAACPRG